MTDVDRGSGAVCMLGRLSMCMYSCMNICVCIKHVCMYARMKVFACICMYVCMYVTYVSMYVTYVCTYVCYAHISNFHPIILYKHMKHLDTEYKQWSGIAGNTSSNSSVA